MVDPANSARRILEMNTRYLLALLLFGCSSNDGTSPPTVDAGPDVVVTIPPPGWSPNDLQPAMWLSDVVEANGDAVTRWVDVTTNHNDAVQYEAIPTPKTIKIGGHSVMSFPGSGMLTVKDSASLHWGLDDFAFILEARFRGIFTPPNGLLGCPLIKKYSIDRASKDAGYPGFLLDATKDDAVYPGMGTQIAKGENSVLVPGYLDGAMHTFIVARRGTDFIFRIDGKVVSQSKINPVDISTPGVDMVIASADDATADPDGRTYPLGEMASLIGVHHTVSDEEMAKAEAYFTALYGH